MRKFTFVEACQCTGLANEALFEWIEREWLSPCGEGELDEEDIARIQLIIQLREDFGVNDEGVTVILHLLDQMHGLRRSMQELLGELHASRQSGGGSIEGGT